MKPDNKKLTAFMQQVEEYIRKHGEPKTKKQVDDFAKKLKVPKPFLDSFFVPRSSKKSKKVIATLQKQLPEVIIGKGGQLDLTIYQHRILDSLLKKFSDNDFLVVKEVKWDGLRITRAELLELAGCERTKHKDGKTRFSGREAKRLQQALEQLATTSQLVITKTVKETPSSSMRYSSRLCGRWGKPSHLKK